MPKSVRVIWLSMSYALCFVSGVPDSFSLKLQMYKIQTTGNGMSDELRSRFTVI